MRDPLVEISHSIVDANAQPTPARRYAPSSSKGASSSSASSTRPKLLRQTSLLAFTRPSPPPPSLLSSPALSLSYTSPSTSELGCSCSSPPSSVAPLLSDPFIDEKNTSSKRIKLDDTSRQVYATADSNDSEDEEEQEQDEQVDPIIQERRMRRMAQNRGQYSINTADHLRYRQYTSLCTPSTSKRPYYTSLAGSQENEYLQSFTSHEDTDIYRCVSHYDDRDFAPPFAATFSNGAKRGGRKLLAIADEEGTVNILDAAKRDVYDSRPTSIELQPHQNAIFDVKWSHDDRLIATGSGDQTAAITDVETKTSVLKLVAHTCSVKQIAFDPHNPNLLATASRDGTIAIWDQRVGTKSGMLEPVNHIRYVHDVYAKTRKGKDSTRSSTRSVTSIVYMHHQDNLLASAGSADGIIKLWDLRKAASRRINPPSVEESPDFSTTGARSHGIASLCLSPDGAKLYALSTTSKIYLHDPQYLSRPSDVPMHVFSSPLLSTSSFYVRLAISPCGRYLASGNSGHRFQTHIWDVSAADGRRGLWGQTEKASVVLNGNDAEVASVDWTDDALVTTSDDLKVRIWRPSR